MEKTDNLKLGFLWALSKILNGSFAPDVLVHNLSDTFDIIFEITDLKIYTYDKNSDTFKDFEKSWLNLKFEHEEQQLREIFQEFNGNHKIILNNETVAANSDIENTRKKFFSLIKIDSNMLFLPIFNQDKPFGLLKIVFDKFKPKNLDEDFLIYLFIALYQISFAVANYNLNEQMKVNVKFHSVMKNIAKITETQYDLSFILPLLGEMVDGFINEHLIYIYLKNDGENTFELVWPLECKNGFVKNVKKSEHALYENNKLGVFPLVSDEKSEDKKISKKKVIGAIVAYNPMESLTNQEIGYLNQLTKQASITVSKAQNFSKMLEFATLDALTGLNNRRQFEFRLKQEIAISKRRKTDLCCIMIDVDFFKKINDTYGHAAGDFVLKTVSNVIKETIRQYDIASRYGGEEFIIILPETPLDEAVLVAERLRLNVENTKIDLSEYGFGEIVITVSAGVNKFHPCGSKSVGQNNSFKDEDFYKGADKALYKAKESGRNRVEVNLEEKRV